MQFPTRKQQIIIALAIYIAAVFLSVNILILKRDALGFHQRDYNYFVEQAARLTDPGLANSFAMQIEGYNFLGLQGIEGVKSLYHAIHTEYFRYLYVLFYGIFRDPLPLFILHSLVFFFPVLYFACMPHPNDRQHLLLGLLFSSLYILFPSTLHLATADLRPRVLFAAAWCLVVLSIYFNRPFWEKLIFFILLIGIREEGILLGAFAIVLNDQKMRGQPGRRLQTIVFLLLDIGALFAFLAFMLWGGYTRVDNVFNPLNFFRFLPAIYWIILLASGMLVLWLLWYAWKKKQYRNTVFWFAYALAVALIGFQWLRDTLRWYFTQSQVATVRVYDVMTHAITNETTGLVFVLWLLIAVILWDSSPGARRKLFMIAFSTLIVFSTAILFSYYPPSWAELRENVAPARLVRDFAATHNRYDTQVLLDYDTYQAFYNYDQVIVYNRLPVWDALPEKRFYPQNKSALVKQIQKGMDYAVISRNSLANVLELAEMAGVPASEISSNDRYVILKFTGISSAQEDQ